MTGYNGTGADLKEVHEDIRMRQKTILKEINGLETNLLALKSSVDGINLNTAQIAKILDKQLSKLLNARIGAFASLITILMIVVIVAVASITGVHVKGDVHSVDITPREAP